MDNGSSSLSNHCGPVVHGIAMIIQLQAADLALVLDLKLQQLAESGRNRLPGDWRERSLARYKQLYREGQCVHFAFRSGQSVVALTGALFIDDAPFLSARVTRYALLVDEFVSPSFLGQGLEGRLRDALLTKIAEKGAILRTTLPPNAARLAACATGNLRL